MYVTDNGNNRVVKVPFGGGPATSFANVVTPDGLAVDASGNVFVADNEDGQIVKITSGGAVSTFESGFEDPVDVAVDPAGNVYIADGTLASILKFPPSGGGTARTWDRRYRTSTAWPWIAPATCTSPRAARAR